MSDAEAHGEKPEPKPEKPAAEEKKQEDVSKSPLVSRISYSIRSMFHYSEDRRREADVEGTTDDFNLTFQADRGGADGLFRPRPHEEDDDWPEFVGRKKIIEKVQAIVGKDYEVDAWDHEKGLFSVGVKKKGTKKSIGGSRMEAIIKTIDEEYEELHKGSIAPSFALGRKSSKTVASQTGSGDVCGTRDGSLGTKKKNAKGRPKKESTGKKLGENTPAGSAY